MSYQIAGKTALITGANRGIGKAIAEGFLEAKIGKLYATARRTETLDPLVEAYGDKIEVLPLDLSNAESIYAAAANADDVDIVVNNGGILKGGDPMSDEAITVLNHEMSVNVIGLMRMAQAFAPVLKKNGGGVFVQMNSIASLRSFPPAATYAMSKAASYSYTMALRDALTKDGIQVISVHPGPIATDMAVNAGFMDIADPPKLVVDGILEAMETGAFHVFPDTMAKQFWEAYQPFGENIAAVDLSAG